MRTIMHVDLDAFYSSIEQRDKPELRGQPVVVGGDPNGRGVVMTASYEARKFGVKSAMPMRTALRLCPRAIVAPPRFDAYTDVSRQLHELFEQLTPIIEPIALDEAFLDLSDRFRTPVEAENEARRLKARITQATELTASVGLATNKLVAKVASDRQKPDGLTVVVPGSEQEFLAALPIRALHGIGPKTEERLHGAGINLAGQLATAQSDWLWARFGQAGLEWQLMARGIDERPVSAYRELKQISRERTFSRDITRRDELLQALDGLVAELTPALQRSDPARTFVLKLRYPDFNTITRRRTLGSVVTADSLARDARDLLIDCWSGRPVRLIGLAIANFVSIPEGQPSLF